MSEEPRKPSLPPLRERLRDGDGGIRLGAAAEALQAETPPAAFQAELAQLLSDSSEDTRKLAALALGRIGPAAFSDLARALDASQPAAVRMFACQAAGAHGPTAASLAGAVGSCVADPDDSLRSAASVALSRIGAASVPALVRALDSSGGAGSLVAAADALGAIGKDADDAANALKRASAHPDPRVGMACADALGRVSGHPASALPGLLSAAQAEDPAVRAEAVRRIGTLQRDGRGAERTILARCGDTAPKVRAASAIALALVGVRGGDLLGTLERLLDDADPEVRVCAAAAAAHVRGEARPLLPRLERLRGDAESRVAAAASAACDAVSGKEPPKPPARIPAAA